MKSRAPLALMEQMVMLLVFAVAAALCMQTFVKSDEISLRSYARSSASFAVSNIAEAIRHSGGSPEHALMGAGEISGGRYEKELDKEGGRLIVFYDEDWNTVQENGAYCLTAQEVPDSGEGVGKVLIQAFLLADKQDEAEQTKLLDFLLFELEVSWLREDIL